MKIKKGENYAEFIKRIRVKKKYTVAEFAYELGVSATIVSLWENEKRCPSFKNQRLIDEYAKEL
jgi:DNA-binding transcriptional regulator YiaG